MDPPLFSTVQISILLPTSPILDDLKTGVFVCI